MTSHDDVGAGLGRRGLELSGGPASQYGALRRALDVVDRRAAVLERPAVPPAQVAASLDARQRVETEWLVVEGHAGLHLADLSLHQLHDLTTDELVDATDTAPLRITCGLTARTVALPGALHRHEAPRCRTCCERTGYPTGTGSPKNDPTCRTVLGTRLDRAQ